MNWRNTLNKINPFSDEGIANFEQFKVYPYLIIQAMDTIDKKINQDIWQINNGHYFGERVLLIGSRGIGKTSALFFIKDKLDKANIKNFTFSNLIRDAEHFSVLVNDSLNNLSEKPFYLLIDFPDEIEGDHYRRFLKFLWAIITHKNYNKINLIFALNHSHFNKSFDYSEILGKFTTLRLEPFNLENTKKLIESRLNLVGTTIDEFIQPQILDLIYSRTNGVPRNIISACNLLYPQCCDSPLEYNYVNILMQDKYFDQVLNDRIEDTESREDYRKMIAILKEDFKGYCTSKVDYVEAVRNKTTIGHHSILAKIKDLIKFGIIIERRGGERRVSRILSLG